MQTQQHPTLYRFLALAIIAVWGFTYISTKILYAHGLSALDVLTLRTALAYVLLLAISPKWLFADTTKDEIKFALLGLVWVPLYYGLEHFALQATQASTVAILLATGPLMTAFIAAIFFRHFRMHFTTVMGLISAATGVFLMWFDNQVMFQLDGMASLMALGAAFCWALYSMMIKTLSGYPLSFIARKAFGYGLLALMPFYIAQGGTPLAKLADATVVTNLLFLGIVTMTLCAVLWSRVSKEIGIKSASQYLYWVPVVSAVAALTLLNDQLSFVGIMGAVMILCGVWVAQYGLKLISVAFAVGDERLLSNASF